MSYEGPWLLIRPEKELYDLVIEIDPKDVLNLHYPPETVIRLLTEHTELIMELFPETVFMEYTKVAEEVWAEIDQIVEGWE